MQGSRGLDFAEANRLAGLNGKSGKATQSAHHHVYGKNEMVWHHVDYDPVTNKAKMQLVTVTDHKAKIPHSGSVAEFEKAHGVTYGDKAAIDKAKELNKLKCPHS